MKNTSTATRRGVAATELAILLPLLSLLSLGTVDLGRYAYTHIVLSNAARSGAERGATRQFTDYTRPDWEDGILEAIVDEMTNLPGFEELGLRVLVTTEQEADDRHRVDVSVDYPFRPLLNWPGLDASLTLGWQASMCQYR